MDFFKAPTPFAFLLSAKLFTWNGLGLMGCLSLKISLTKATEDFDHIICLILYEFDLKISIRIYKT